MGINKRTAIATAALSLTLSPAWAQQPGHQMPGVASGSGASAATCAQNSEGVTRTIDSVNARIEDARQINDASKLRASIADLQSVFAQMKTQLADCVALAADGGGAMGSMPGMDHSKMNVTPGTPVMQPGSPTPAPGAAGGAAMPGMDHSKMQMPAKPAAAKAATPAAGMDHAKMPEAPKSKERAPEPEKMVGMDHSKMAADTAAAPAGGAHEDAAPAAAVVFTVRTDPAPPRSGRNDFEVTLKDAQGKPIADAAVSLAFSMPAMPSMKADAAQLTSAGNGAYKGSGTVGMAGDWDVILMAVRNGQTIATKKIRITVK